METFDTMDSCPIWYESWAIFFMATKALVSHQVLLYTFPNPPCPNISFELKPLVVMFNSLQVNLQDHPKGDLFVVSFWRRKKNPDGYYTYDEKTLKINNIQWNLIFFALGDVCSDTGRPLVKKLHE